MTTRSFKIHVCPGVDARAAARDLRRDGVVGIDDIGETLYDVIRDEILDYLGHASDGVDWKTQRVNTAFGPVFVVRDPDLWSAAVVKQAVTRARSPARDQTPAAKEKKQKEPRLLSGGNPQISKGDGNEVVQAYLAAMPGWKREVGRSLDALVVRVVPDVRKAVRWNTPFYGVEGHGWFFAFHCITKYVKVSFFRGTSLRPIPPVASKSPEVRYVHLFEGERIDEAHWPEWITQASRLPGAPCF